MSLTFTFAAEPANRHEMRGSLLVSHKSGSVSLDLSFEFRRADRLTAGRRPHGLYQLGKFYQNRKSRVTHTRGLQSTTKQIFTQSVLKDATQIQR